MKELTYPFDSQLLLKKRRSLKQRLQEQSPPFRDKRIAILGGSTTHDIKDMLELFLLNYGIRPSFYESEYGQFWQDAMFDNPELVSFQPELVFIHTNYRNITQWPTVSDNIEAVESKLAKEFEHYSSMWDKLTGTYHCPIIQNNFEMPFYRLLGNKDASDYRGRTNFLSCLNQCFYQYAQTHTGFYINDINYLSADYGLKAWSDPFYWHMYKYALAFDAIPTLAFSVANIVKSIYGKNKKALVLDLDNTLWGGIIGDYGVDGIEIGHETSMGQVFSEFQQYLRELKSLGVILNIDSKNDLENAMAGLNHPEGTLKPDDFIVIKANWMPKDQNFHEIAEKLNILPESMVFCDDNPAERHIVSEQISGVAVPELDKPEHYIYALDRNAYFEVTELSQDDLKRNEMYEANAKRESMQKSFADYKDYLLSLDMEATIRDFEPVYLPRIAQLTNKSNQFNLTTKRLSESEMEEIFRDEHRIRLYGKLTDRFGDNGVISVVIGRIEEDALHIELWLMSCRVLKRDMEHAMLDRLVEKAKERGLRRLIGYYYPTSKNGMVKDFYSNFGFSCITASDNGSTVWELNIEDYQNKNTVMRVIK